MLGSDIVFVSEATRQLILLELTMLRGERTEEEPSEVVSKVSGIAETGAGTDACQQRRAVESLKVTLFFGKKKSLWSYRYYRHDQRKIHQKPM